MAGWRRRGRGGPTLVLSADRRLTRFAGSLYLSFLAAGWSSLVARRAHNPKVAGSNPAPATWKRRRNGGAFHVARRFDERWQQRRPRRKSCRRRPKPVDRGLSGGRVARGRCVGLRPIRGRALAGGEAGLAGSPGKLPTQPPAPTRFGRFFGQVAQLVEHATENRGVGGSIPSLAIYRLTGRRIGRSCARGSVAQLVEHRSPKPGVGGSSPSGPVQLGGEPSSSNG